MLKTVIAIILGVISECVVVYFGSEKQCEGHSRTTMPERH